MTAPSILKKCMKSFMASAAFVSACFCLPAAAEATAGSTLGWDDVSLKTATSAPAMQPLGISGVSSVIPSPLPATVEPISSSSGVPEQKPFFVKQIVASGTLDSLTLWLEVYPEAIPATPVQVFFGANVPARYSPSEVRTPSFAYDKWFINNGSGWSQFIGGVIPPFLSNINAMLTRAGNLLSNMSVLNYCGIELYVGAGESQEEMLNAGRLGKVYTIPCPYSFVADASGTMSDLTLTAHVKVSPADTGRTGSFYVGKNARDSAGDHWYFHNGAQWVAYGGGAFVPYATGPLADRDIVVLNHENATGLGGSAFYVGYAQSQDELLNSRKYGEIYRLP